MPTAATTAMLTPMATPTNYKWTLSRRTEDDELSGCWLLDNMAPDTPPIDVDAGARDVALEAATATTSRSSSPVMSAAAEAPLTVGDVKVKFTDG